jgi:hypothetical protein
MDRSITPGYSAAVGLCLCTQAEGRIKVIPRKEATVIWTILAIIGLIVVLQWIF